MPVHVKCPGCGTVLAAPDSAAGSVMSCPQCRNQFMVPGSVPPVPAMAAAGGGMPPAAPPMFSAPTAPSLLGGGAKAVAGPAAASGTATMSGAPPAPPSTGRTPYYPPGPATPGTATANASPPAMTPPSAAPPLGRNANVYPPGMSPPTPTRTASAAPPVAPSSAAASRQTNAAKFIAADASATKIDLAADGRLPSLQLEELDEEEGPAEPKSSNPMVMVGVLAFSVLASVAMLFIDSSSPSTNRPTAEMHRNQIRNWYLPSQEQMEKNQVVLKPYQKRLRDALLANNRGDYTEEKRCYREVLDMLHMEGRNEFTGITGSARGETPPNDRDLEITVSALLSGR